MSAVEDPDTAPQVHVEPRIAWFSIIGFWAFYYIINTIRMAIADEPGQWEKMGSRAAVTSCGVGLTWLLWLLLRRIEHRSLPMLVTTAFLAAIPLSAAYSSINFFAFYVVSRSASDMQEMSKHGPAEIVCDTALTWYFFVVAWAVLYIALAYAAKVRHAERSAARYRAEAQEAQLRALRYQVNPHFLFNTLNSLSTLVLQGRNEEAERMIMNLSTFFRSSLATELNDELPLADEIRMQQLYLDIEQVRFPDRLRVEIDISPEIYEAAIPAMLLQPVVENAIKHGVARSTDPVTLTIFARPEGTGTLRIMVGDNAVPANDRSRVTIASGHVGLSNVRARLEGRYGNASSCHYGPRSGGGFEVTLTLPLSAGRVSTKAS